MMAVIFVAAGIPAPVTGIPIRRPAALATVTLKEPAETTVPSKGKALAVTIPMAEYAPVLELAVAGKIRPATFWTIGARGLPRNVAVPPRSSIVPSGLRRLVLLSKA